MMAGDFYSYRAALADLVKAIEDGMGSLDMWDPAYKAAKAALELPLDGPNSERDAGALAIEFVEQQPCPRWPDATALKCAKKGEEYPRCRYCDAARAIRRTHATGILQGEKT